MEKRHEVRVGYDDPDYAEILFYALARRKWGHNPRTCVSAFLRDAGFQAVGRYPLTRAEIARIEALEVPPELSERKKTFIERVLKTLPPVKNRVADN